MENHPIPQDITGFQFKLIGNMTVKQFAYLAAGAICAWLVYAIPIPVIVKLILIPLFLGTGFAVSFIPIEGRPMDVMFMQFLRALTTSTQFIYHKQGRELAILSMMPHKQVLKQKSQQQSSAQKLQAYLQTIQPTRETPLDTKEATSLKNISSLLVSTAIPAAAPVPLQTPSLQNVSFKQPQQVTNQLASIFSSISSGQQQREQPLIPQPQKHNELPSYNPAFTPLSQLQSAVQPKEPPKKPAGPQQQPQAPHIIQYYPLGQRSPSPVIVPPPVQKENSLKQSETLNEALEQTAKTIEQQLQATKVQEQTQKNKEEAHVAQEKAAHLEKQLQETLKEQQNLREQVIKLQHQLSQQPVFTPSEAKTPTETQNVRKVAKPQAKLVGLPFVSDAANVIAGIIKDPRGNVLPNILVEVKDKGGNPVRAFKTNALGQFASATPLVNGVYTIDFEDPQKQHKFDAVEITASGKTLQPIEVISVDAREELRQVLFTPKA